MKAIITFLLAAVAASLSGCMASDIISSASTKVQVSDPNGKSFSLTFPKELQATGFHVVVDPSSGQMKVDADQIKSSSSALVESASAAQAQSIATMSNTLAQIVPILAKAAAVSVNPAAAPILAAADTPAQPASPEPATAK